MWIRRWGGALAIALVAAVVVPPPATALSATELRSRIADLKQTLRAVAADLDEAEHDLEDAEIGIAKHRKALQRAQSRRAQLRETIGRRAAELYMNAADTGPLQMLAETLDINTMLDRMSYLEQVRRGETQMLEEVRALQERAAVESAELRKVQADAKALRDRLSGRQAELESKLDELQRLQNFLASVSSRSSLRASRSGRGIVCPVGGSVIVSNNYGDPRPGGPHAGIDIRAHYGQPVRAVLPATVVDTPYGSWIGVGIVIRDLAGNEWWYAHLSSERVSVGQKVLAGETIGYVGCTGRCYGNHLHFEYHPGGGDPRDPYTIVSRAC